MPRLRRNLKRREAGVSTSANTIHKNLKNRPRDEVARQEPNPKTAFRSGDVWLAPATATMTLKSGVKNPLFGFVFAFKWADLTRKGRVFGGSVVVLVHRQKCQVADSMTFGRNRTSKKWGNCEIFYGDRCFGPAVCPLPRNLLWTIVRRRIVILCKGSSPPESPLSCQRFSNCGRV